MGRTDGIRCPICGDSPVEPRMLSCWHSACYSCILTSIQNGEKRVVYCPSCRQTTIFKDIQVVPESISCASSSCDNYVINPWKFPCCDRLFCCVCIEDSKQHDGTITCLGGCNSESTYFLGDLPNSKICSMCFTLHLEPNKSCGKHSLCQACGRGQREQWSGRSCRVCQDVDRLQSAPEEDQRPIAKHGATVGMTDQRRTNVHNEIQKLLGLAEILRTQQQHELQRIQQQQSQLQQLRSSELNQAKNGYRILCFWTVWTSMVFIYSLNITNWIVLMISLMALRLDNQERLFTLVLTATVMFCMSVYYFQQQSSIFYLVSLAIGYISFRAKRIEMIVSAVVILPVVILYFDQIFLLRMILECILATLLRIDWLRRRPIKYR